jgi:hypothetical protein
MSNTMLIRDGKSSCIIATSMIIYSLRIIASNLVLHLQAIYSMNALCSLRIAECLGQHKYIFQTQAESLRIHNDLIVLFEM